jgi:hypothetical protein
MKIYVDGLERSGNVYLSYVLGYSFDQEIKSTRSHFVETLKNYKDFDPFIVPLRDALESVSSAKVYRDYVYKNKTVDYVDKENTEFEVILKRYKDYTDYLVENPQFFIAPFYAFTKDHNIVVSKIIKFYPNHKELIQKNVLTKEEIFNKMFDGIDKMAYHPQLGNFPREDNEEKYQIRYILLDKYNKEIDDIQSNIDILYKRYEAI